MVEDQEGQLKQPQTIDRALTLHLEEQYMEGEGLASARYMIAAVLFFTPLLRSPGMKNLPQVKQSLAGWQKLCPPRSRLPVPFEVVMLIAKFALRLGNQQMAMYLLILRPGEGLRLRKKDLVTWSSPVLERGAISTGSVLGWSFICWSWVKAQKRRSSTNTCSWTLLITRAWEKRLSVLYDSRLERLQILSSA